ncbi:hypothetical protein ACFXPT_39440 [Streptomyces goshikiensis]|uniref:hypothetical protein n=1 Tax=Streptomyces goshikiensis TaxID=1942 RepID=UPI0036C9C9A3
MSEMYAFIEAEKTIHPVACLCWLLKENRSSFYNWLAGAEVCDIPEPGGSSSLRQWFVG